MKVFLVEASETLEGRPPDKQWATATDSEKYSSIGRVVYFGLHDPRLRDWLGHPAMSRGYAYLRLQGTDGPPRFQASRLNASLARSAPIALPHPYRYLGWSVVLVGLIFYAVVPWPRRSAKQFSPMSPCNAFLADSVGYALLGTFIATWAALVNSRNLPGYGEWSQIIVFTLVLWGMALSGAVILAVVVRYLSWRLKWDEQGIVVETLFQNRRLNWQEVKHFKLQPIEYRIAERIRILGWLLILFQPRAAGPVLAMQTKSTALCLETDRGSYRVDLGNLSSPGLTEFANACRSHNVPVLDEFCRISTDRRAEGSRRVWPIYVTLLILAGIVWYFLRRSMTGLI